MGYVPGGPIVRGGVNDALPFPEANRPHGSYHWAFERLLSAALIPATGAAFALSNSAYPVVDALLGVSLVMHSHIGVCIDTFPHVCSCTVTETLLPPSLTLSSLTTSTPASSRSSALAHPGVSVLRLPVFLLACTSSTRTTLVGNSFYYHPLSIFTELDYVLSRPWGVSCHRHMSSLFDGLLSSPFMLEVGYQTIFRLPLHSIPFPFSSLSCYSSTSFPARDSFCISTSLRFTPSFFLSRTLTLSFHCAF
jgi:hypothetical protein